MGRACHVVMGSVYQDAVLSNPLDEMSGSRASTRRFSSFSKVAFVLLKKITRGVKPMNKIQFTAKEREFVYGVAMKYMKDEEKAHDVTQDALLLAYRHRASFRGDSRFTT